MSILEHIGITLPIFQAPMAGISTPALAAAVSNAGGLGAIAVGAMNADTAHANMTELRALTDKPFNVNVFTHEPPIADTVRESAWIEVLRPSFTTFDATPPQALRTIYTGFNQDDAMLAAIVEAAPRVVSFHFGLPDAVRCAALKATGAILLASATSLAEAHLAARAGMDVIIAQGYEAGGHRGIFDPNTADECLSTAALTRLLVRETTLPVVAAGGIMTGGDIAAVLEIGAVAAQLGTAFIACPQASTEDAHRAALLSADVRTEMTTAISGRPARCIVNRFTQLGHALSDVPRPDYPIAYDAGKALHAAAKAKGEFGYGAQWAGQGARQARAMPAQDLVRVLARELESAQQG